MSFKGRIYVRDKGNLSNQMCLGLPNKHELVGTVNSKELAIFRFTER